MKILQVKMLNSLEALAGKISPGSGKNSPQQGLDNNANKINHVNHNTIHPYQKPAVLLQNQNQQNINNNNINNNVHNNNNSPSNNNNNVHSINNNNSPKEK